MENKKRLIWDEDVQRRLVELAVKRGNVAIPLNRITNILFNESQTVDAMEVVHGRWIWDIEIHGDPMYGVDEDFGYRCSECKVWADEYGVDGDIYKEPPTHILHYCPNCGVKMDLEC